MKRSFTVINTAPDEAMLHAYVDGELSSEARAGVETWLANNPPAMAEVNAWRRQNQLLNRLARTDQLPQMPPDMAASLSALGPAGPRGRQKRQHAVGVALTFLAGASAVLAALYVSEDRTAPSDTFARQAVDAHRTYAALSAIPSRKAPTVGMPETVRIGGLAAIDATPPDLTSTGLSLAMHRIVANGPSPAAQMLYIGTGGGRVSLYIRDADSPGDQPYTFARSGGAGLLYWQSQDAAFALVGDLGEARLTQIAAIVDAAFEGERPPAVGPDEALANSGQPGSAAREASSEEGAPSASADEAAPGGNADAAPGTAPPVVEKATAQET